MRANNTLPPNYQLFFQLDILNNRKMFIKLTLLGLVAILPWMVFFLVAIYLLRGEDLFVWPLGVKKPLLFTLILLLVMAATIALHEWTHGLFLWYYSKARPEFGLKLPLYAYATMPGWYFPRNAFLVVLLAPLAVISALGLLLTLLLPSELLLFAFALLGGNAASAIGDLYMTFVLLRYPPDTLVEDTGTGFRLYRPTKK
jgi:hypothetical protein